MSPKTNQRQWSAIRTNHIAEKSASQELVLKLYTEGRTVSEISRLCNRSITWVRNLLKVSIIIDQDSPMPDQNSQREDDLIQKMIEDD